MAEQLVIKIKALLTEIYPDLANNDYQAAAIKKLVDHFEKIGQLDEPIFGLSFTESIRVDSMNGIKQALKKDIIKDGYQYTPPFGVQVNNEFERGIWAAIALIEHRVHCICDT